MMEAIGEAQAHHEAIRNELEAEQDSIRMQMTQKETAVDRYLTDYEDGKLDKKLIEQRVKKLSDELTELRHRRDDLQFQLDNTPGNITATELKGLSADITKIITMGQVAQRKALCDLVLDKIELNTATATATPTFRVNIAHAVSSISTTNDENAPAGSPAGAHLSSSRAVRERRPTVEPRGSNRRHTSTRPARTTSPILLNTVEVALLRGRFPDERPEEIRFLRAHT